MTQILVIGLGGFLGAIARYTLSSLVQERFQGQFPVGTLAVNVLGCLAIGVLMTLVEERQMFGPDTRLFLMIGLLGSLTTFSTFGYEAIEFLRDGQVVQSFAMVAAQVILGLGAVIVGRAAVRWIAS